MTFVYELQHVDELEFVLVVQDIYELKFAFYQLIKLFLLHLIYNQYLHNDAVKKDFDIMLLVLDL